MARFTKDLRQQIIRDYAERNGGRYDARGFMEEVRATGPDHPAYEWFTWDDVLAAETHRIWQAREFATGLRVSFEVQTIQRGKMVVRSVEAPMLHSPIDTRREGLGYRLTEPDDESMAALAVEASRDLQRFIERYAGVVTYWGGSLQSLDRVAKQLEHAAARESEAA